jgi:hypothetical protein
MSIIWQPLIDVVRGGVNASSDGSWSIETVDSEENMGYFTSIALDANGHPHISYYAGLPNENLKYARWTGSAWAIETVDSEGWVGAYTSIALDANGYPHISYYDITNRDLKYARLTMKEEPFPVWYLTGAIIAVLAVIGGAAVLYRQKHRE